MQISRIRLSDKTSRLHPRHVVPKRCQTHETEVPVEVREWIAPAPAPPDLVLVAQPPTQPRSRVDVERPIRFVDGAYLEVVRPPAQRAVQRTHQLRGVLPCHRLGGQRMDFLDHALDALLRWPVPAEYSRPNVYPRKSNSPSGTLQIRVFSSLTVSFSLPMISRSRCRASSALPFLHRITRSSA